MTASPAIETGCFTCGHDDLTVAKTFEQRQRNARRVGVPFLLQLFFGQAKKS